jgi:hypothetical protein
MILDTIHRPARRFLLERLERFHEALDTLGQRLREGIAQLISKHVGDAIRDAIESVLGNRRAHFTPERHLPQNRSYHDPYGYPYGDDPEDGFWEDREEVPDEAEPQQPPWRWRSLLTGLTQLVAWSVRSSARRPSLKKLLCLGAGMGILTLLAGPVVGGIVTAISTTILLAVGRRSHRNPWSAYNRDIPVNAGL